MKKKTKIPKFKTREEEAKFWDTHSFADYWDEFEDIDLVVALNKPRDETLVLRLQKGLKIRLEKVAKAKGLNVSALARMWLMEKLQQQNRP
jgi:hypothetical protein